MAFTKKIILPTTEIIGDPSVGRYDADKVLRIARNELGVAELPGQASNPQIIRYFSATGYRPSDDSLDAWCAAFISWLLEEADIKSTKSASAKSYTTWGTECAPQPGAVVTFKRNGGSGYHVGIIETVVDSKTVNIISGNDNNAVRRSVRLIENIATCRRPV